MVQSALPKWARYALAFALGAAVLLILFELFGATPPRVDPPRTLPAGVVWTLWALGAVGAVFVAVQLRRAYLRSSRLSRQHREGIALLNAGRYDEALAAFEEITRSTKPTEAVYVYPRYHVGHTLLRLGRVDEAVVALKDASAHPRAQADLRVFALISSELALAHALAGDVVSAKACLDEVPAKRIPEPPAEWVFAWTAIAIREGRFKEAADYLERSWPVLERRLGTHDLRALQMIAAAAMERSGGHAERALDLRARAGPPVPEVAWVSALLK